MRVYALTVRNRLIATLALLALIGLGAAVVAVGFTLLLGLAAAGTLVGAGVSIYNRVRGRRVDVLPRSGGLDPRLEVFQDRRTLESGDPRESDSQK
jgi:uncharacterized protein (DUF58 family)